MVRKAVAALAVFMCSGAALAAETARFDVVPLVSDQPGIAAKTDANLVNPWGISHQSGGPLWVSDNVSGKSTIYNPTTGAKIPPAVTIPRGGPTGTVYVPPGVGFNIPPGVPSQFLFDTVTGVIAGWYIGANAVIAVDRSKRGSVYTGLALDPIDKLLFAADFAKNQVQIFDHTFTQVGHFTDSTLPPRFAPFNAAWLNNKLYVAFAKRVGRAKPGRGLGYVDVFDAEGNLLQHLIAAGKLNAPWGLTIAPAGFGRFAGALLVGNLGDGKINAYDAVSGDFLGTLKDTAGKPLVIDGLWALDAGTTGEVTFTAGPDDETHGLLGILRPHPAGANLP